MVPSRWRVAGHCLLGASLHHVGTSLVSLIFFNNCHIDLLLDLHTLPRRYLHAHLGFTKTHHGSILDA